MGTANCKHGLYFATAIASLCLWVVAPAFAQTKAGQFQFVMGEIKIISATGAERVPVKGDAFQPGDTIATGANGMAQIRMSDGGFIAVRADTHMRLDQYVFNGREDGSERSLVSLVKGGFRAITGLIGNRNKDNYRINTATATIGIRGTDHEPVVIPAGAPGASPPGTYDRVYRGAVIMQTEKGQLLINPNQVGFVSGKNAAPVLLPKIPEFYDRKPQATDPGKDSDATPGGERSSSGDDATTANPTAGAARAPTDTTLKRDPQESAVQILRTPLDTTSPVKDLAVDPSSALKSTTIKGDRHKEDTVKSLPTDKLKTDTTPALPTDALRPSTRITDTAIKSPSAVIDTTTTPKTAPIRTAPIATTPITTTPITRTPIGTTPVTPVPATVAPITKPVPRITAPVTTTPKTVPKTETKP